MILAELPDPDGTPALVHLRQHRYQDILLMPAQTRCVDALEPRGRGVRYGVQAGSEDLRARAAQAGRVGGGTVEGPARTAWNTLDLICRDPDGYEVILTQPVAADLVDQQFAATVRCSMRA